MSAQLGRYIALECKEGTKVLSFKPLGYAWTRSGKVGGLKVIRTSSFEDGVSWCTGAIDYTVYEVVKQ
jgi:hypothetical protein